MVRNNGGSPPGAGKWDWYWRINFCLPPAHFKNGLIGAGRGSVIVHWWIIRENPSSATAQLQMLVPQMQPQ
jgi:hypothetical protein